MARNAARLSRVDWISEGRVRLRNDGDGRLTLYLRDGTSHWYADIKLPGRPRKQIALSAGDLQTAIPEAERHFRGLVYRLERQDPPKDPSVSDVAALWLNELELQAKSGEMPPTKLDTIRSNLNSLLPFFGKIGISQVHERDIADYRQLRKRAGTEKSRLLTYQLGDRTIVKRRPSHHVRPVKDTTVNRQFNTLRGIFNYAVLNRIIGRACVPALPSVNVRGNPRTWFSVEEYKRLRRASWSRVSQAVSMSERYHRALLHWLIAFMVISGLRPAEINNLQWKHIEHVRQRRTGGGSFQSVVIWARAKLKARQTMPPPSIMYILNKLKKLQERSLGRPIETDDRVFPVSDEAVSRAFKKLLNAAGLLTDRFGETRVPMSLRHSSISFVLLRRNWPIYETALWAGTSVKMIEDYYSALTPQMLATRRGQHPLRSRWG